MGLLEGKHIVITGVLTDASLAFGVAKLAQEEGAEIVLTGAGRGLSLTERTARKLASPPVFELDVAEPAHLVAVRDAVAGVWDRVDGVLHAIGYAPPVCLGGTFMEADVGRRRRGHEHLRLLAQGAGRRLRAADDRRAARSSGSTSTPASPGRPTTGWAWPRPPSSRRPATWPASSGPSGVRVNLVAAGPVRTMAAKSIPGFSAFEDVWDDKAPLGWDVNDSSAVSPRPASPCSRTGSP